MRGKLTKEFAWILSGKLASSATSIVLVKLLTQEMSIPEYGTLALGLTIFNLFTQIIMGSFGQGVGRVYIVAIEKFQYATFKNATLTIFNQITIFYLFIIATLIPIVWHFFDSRLTAFVLLLVFYSYIFGINDIAIGLHNLARNRRESALATMLEQALKVGFILSMISYTSIDIIHVAIAYILATLSTLVYQFTITYKFQAKSSPCASDSENRWRDQVMKISGPASFWGLFVWMQQASDKWALQMSSSSVDVALYSVLYQISYAPFLIGIGILMTFFIPMIYSSTDHKKIVFGMLWFIFTVTVTAAIFGNFYGESILLGIAGEEYSSVASLMPCMIMAAGFYQAGDVLSSHFMRLYETKLIMFVKIITSIFCVACNFVGAYLFGVNGVASALLLFGLLYFTCFCYFSFAKKDYGL